jgi:hypothetical protein
MRLVVSVIVVILGALSACSAQAASETVLIQLQKDGRYVVWYSEGQTRLTDDELTTLAASAKPEGGDTLLTTAGPANAFEVPHAILVVLPNARADKRLLIDRDACGGVKIWHSEGATVLTDDQLTDLVLSALPDGGKRLSIGGNYAKAYAMELGVVAVIWAPVQRSTSP